MSSMSLSVKNMLSVSAIAIVMSLSAAPALAQEAQEAAAPAAPEAAAEESVEIVVTAQFREQALQDTPLAITAITADSLANRSFTSTAEIASTAPNVQLRVANSAFGNTLQAFIRGIGQGDYNYATEPGVGVYIDDVYYSTTFGAVFDLLDLERVEVLRGPQGTLFGKNSIGGAIRLVSKKPRGTGEGYVEATYGSFNRIDVRGSADIPLIQDQLAVRIAASAKNREGYQKLLDFACARPDLNVSVDPDATYNGVPNRTGNPSSCKLGEYGGQDVQSGRVALSYFGSDTVEMNITADYMKDDSQSAADNLIAIGNGTDYNTIPGTTTGLPGLLVGWNNNVNIPTFGVPFDARFLTNDPYTTYATYDDVARGIETSRKSTVESWGVNGTVDINLTDTIALKSVSAYRTYNGHFAHDPDQSPLVLENVDNYLNHEAFSQELRLSGTAVDDRLFWTFGGFYFDATGKLEGMVAIYPIGLAFSQKDKVTITNKSVFAHGEFEVTDRLTAIAGIRYTDETKTYFFNHPPFITNGGEPYESTAKFDRVDYRFTAKYDVTDDVNVYATYSTGFRGGGVNPRPFTPAQLIPFGPEVVEAYELGFKTSLFDNQLRLNGAAFRTDFKNRQQNRQTVDNDGLPFTGPTNLGTGKIEGFELELDGRIAGFTLNGQVGYADFSTNDVGAAQGRPGTPLWTASAGAQYDYEVGSASTITPRLDWVYQSRIDYANNADDLAATPKRGIWNGRITYKNEDHNYSVALSVTNLFDKFYYVNKFTLIPFGLGTLEGQPARPREWAVTVKKSF